MDEANAALLSAAPDLLAACEDGIKFLQCLPDTECEQQQDNRRACYKIFTAAIEKAKTV